MNEYVLYQPCITSWSIVLFHPTNLSFSQRLINYGRDSVSNYDLIANQSTPRWGRTWLTVWPMHTHARRGNCVSYQRVLFFFFFPISGIMGKFLAAVMVSLLGRQYWSVGLPAVNTLDGSPRHLVQTIVVRRRAVTTFTPWLSRSKEFTTTIL